MSMIMINYSSNRETPAISVSNKIYCPLNRSSINPHSSSYHPFHFRQVRICRGLWYRPSSNTSQAGSHTVTNSNSAMSNYNFQKSDVRQITQ